MVVGWQRSIISCKDDRSVVDSRTTYPENGIATFQPLVLVGRSQFVSAVCRSPEHGVAAFGPTSDRGDNSCSDCVLVTPILLAILVRTRLSFTCANRQCNIAAKQASGLQARKRVRFMRRASSCAKTTAVVDKYQDRVTALRHAGLRMSGTQTSEHAGPK